MADVAFEAWGRDLAELFSSAADAVMNVMVSGLGTIENRKSFVFVVRNDDIEMLLFNFLQELIFYKDARKLILRIPSVSIEQKNSHFTLNASAFGEKLDPARHRPIVDVKAVTLYRFSLRKTDDGWKATVVLDI